MTSKEARQHTCAPGNWLWNIAMNGDDPDWQERIKPPDYDVNDRRLFGYDETDFLRKQYK